MTERVSLAERSYDVCVTSGFAGLADALSALFGEGAARAIVVTDDTVGPLWLDALATELPGEPRVCVLPAGEQNKTVPTWSDLVSELLMHRIDRRTPVIALGGGVVGDITGFAAACVLRGVPFVQVPTTVLAMVDSSVGGKTGVNHALGKNLVGAFHQPRLVWAALDTLSTLDLAEVRAGLGEVLKTALIAGGPLWDLVLKHGAAMASGDTAVLGEAVLRCVRAKADVVAQDEREGGVRAVLNAGHTVGHALEQTLGYGALRHGEAVAIGLISEARYAVRTGVCVESGLPAMLERCRVDLQLPDAQTALQRGPRGSTVTLEALMKAVVMDKKAVGDMVRLPLPVRPGECILVDVPHRGLETLLGDCL